MSPNFSIQNHKNLTPVAELFDVRVLPKKFSLCTLAKMAIYSSLPIFVQRELKLYFIRANLLAKILQLKHYIRNRSFHTHKNFIAPTIWWLTPFFKNSSLVCKTENQYKSYIFLINYLKKVSLTSICSLNFTPLKTTINSFYNV